METLTKNTQAQPWVKQGYTLGTISAADAQRLMMLPSVAGGWIMVPDNWSNGSPLWDACYDSYHDRYLALIPNRLDVSVRPIDKDRYYRILAAAKRDIAWHTTHRRKADQLSVVKQWVQKLEAAVTFTSD